MTIEIALAAIVGFLISVLPEKLPIVKAWWEAQPPQVKSIVQLFLLIVSAGALYATACSGLLEFVAPGLKVTCDTSGIYALIAGVWAAASANQATYLLFFSRKKAA